MGDTWKYRGSPYVERCLKAITNHDRIARTMSIDWSALLTVPTAETSSEMTGIFQPVSLNYTVNVNDTAEDDLEQNRVLVPELVKEMLTKDTITLSETLPPVRQIDRLYPDYLNQQTPGPYRSVYACCGPYCPERPPVTKRMKCYTCGELMSEVKNG